MRHPDFIRVFLLAFLLLSGLSLGAQDYSSLTASNHPRLFLDNSRFDELRHRVSAAEPKDSVLLELHGLIMSRAESIGLEPGTIEYRFDESGKRLLHRSREALEKIFLCSYAYRFTSDRRFLDHARKHIETVCAFPGWNAERHFLDAAEMAAAVGIGFDWLYDDLPETTKSMAFDALNRYAFLPASDETVAGFYFSEGNWNQVCNAGLVAGALATYERSDTTAQRIISDAIASNRRAMKSIYSPDGNYAEGPSYWSYGNMFQVLLLSEFETVLGTDFGLSDTEGFDRTPIYKTACQRPGHRLFNYSDNTEFQAPSYPLWYFAVRFGDSSLLENELEFLREGSYASPEEVRLLPLLMMYALDIQGFGSSQTPESIYIGGGDTPILTVKASADCFLGLKGGSPHVSHSHMDGGSFVYDAFGHCWAMDIPRLEYVDNENMCFAVGGDFWDMSQNSPRWQFLRLNNKAHNTLTINDKDHCVKGAATLVSSIDSAGWRGGVMDLTSLFGGQVAAATRRVLISDAGELRVEDTIVAQDTLDAHIRWTMVTPAQVSVAENGITLTQDDVKMLLRTESETPLHYTEWSADPKDYDTPFAGKEPAVEGVTLCGYEATVGRGTKAVFVTTIRKNFYTFAN